MRALLSAARIEDLYSAGQWQADLLDDLEQARADRNWTAVAAFRRMAGQALGVLKDRVVLSAEQSMADADLVAQLAGGDKGKLVVLAEVLGKRSFGNSGREQDRLDVESRGE